MTVDRLMGIGLIAVIDAVTGVFALMMTDYRAEVLLMVSSLN